MKEKKEGARYVQTVEKVGGYDADAIRNAVDREFAALEIEKEISPEMKVLLKPNLVGDYNPFFAVTTNPAVVEAVAGWLTDHGCRNVCIADSPGGAVSTMPDFDYDAFYRGVGYDRLERNGVWLNRDTGWGVKQAPEGCRNRSFHLLNAVLEADYIINIPKLKTHNTTTVSIGIKNLFGCVPDIQKPIFHAKYPRRSDFSNMLVELAMTVNPSLTVVDGIEILEGNGPVAGKKRDLGLLCAAKDVFSQDRFLAETLGVRAESVGMLAEAERKGLFRTPELRSGSFDAGAQIPPLVLPDLQTSDTVLQKLKAVYQILNSKKDQLFVSVQPAYVPGNCSHCLRCVSSCPVKAISIEQGQIRFRYDACIGCLCCHEVCSSKAITVQKRRKKKRS